MKKIRFLICFFILIFIFGPASYGFVVDEDIVIDNNILTNSYSDLLEKNTEESLIPEAYNVTSIKKKERYSFFNSYSVNGILPPSYRLDDYIDLMVKNQKNTKECWAMQASSMLESHISKTTGETSELYSSRHINYMTSDLYSDFSRSPNEGGNSYIALAYYTSGKGPVLESDFPFENNSNELSISDREKYLNAEPKKWVKEYVQFTSIDKEISGNSVAYKVDGEEISSSTLTSLRNDVKEHIKNYGGVTAYSFEDSTYSNYFNNSNIMKSTSFYCNDSSISPNHQVLIVGWDDSYSRNNFNSNCRPLHDGAYIALNTYGSSSFDNGYIYISYDDVLVEKAMFGIKSVSDILYNNLYQYDELGASAAIALSSNIGYGANVFNRDSIDSEYLTSVGISLNGYSKVQVFVNPSSGVDDINNMVQVTGVSDVLEPRLSCLRFR